MKRYTIAIACLFMAVAGLYSCDDNDSLPAILPTDRGTFTDERDGKTYGWVRIGDLDWMTENLNYGTPYYEKEYGGVFADDSGYPQEVYSNTPNFDFAADVATYGNYYTYEEARDSCPAGWRLPSDEDWKNLEMALGMSREEADSEDWRGEGVATLMRQGEEGTGLNFLLGGNVWASASYGWSLYVTDEGEFGWYWSSTEVETTSDIPIVYFRKMFYGYSTVCRRTSPTNVLMRVRCVRDAAN